MTSGRRTKHATDSHMVYGGVDGGRVSGPWRGGGRSDRGGATPRVMAARVSDGVRQATDRGRPGDLQGHDPHHPGWQEHAEGRRRRRAVRLPTGVDAGRDPKTFDAKEVEGLGVGRTYKGIWEVEGDTLKWCFSTK